MDDIDRAILTLEGRWFRRPGSKLAAIAEFGLSETRYWQRVLQLSSDPMAAAEYPAVVASIQRRLHRAA